MAVLSDNETRPILVALADAFGLDVHNASDDVHIVDARGVTVVRMFRGGLVNRYGTRVPLHATWDLAARHSTTGLVGVAA